MKENKTYDYISRNDDGGKKPIGFTGLFFGAVVMLAFFFVAVNELMNAYL